MAKNALIPVECPSCGKPVKVLGLHLVCVNKQCPSQVIQTILHWVTSRKMDGIAESTIRSLYEAGKIKTILDLYNLTEKKLQGLAGFGDAKIKNILSEIERTKSMTIGEFIDAIGVELVGIKAMAKMGITTESELWAFKGDGSVVGSNLIAYLKENKGLVEALLTKVSIKAPKIASKGSKNVCMTGSGPDKRDNLIKAIEAKGDVFVDHVAKGTDILVCEDRDGQSSKLLKAKKIGVKLMNYDEYFT